MDTIKQNLEVKQKAEELIHIIKTRFIREDGLLARNYPVRKRTLFDNFDDLVPFFLFFGEAEFLLSQVRIIRQNNESMLSLCAKNGVLMTSTIDEWFGGWYALWQATGDRSTYRLLKESVEFILTNLMQKGFLSAAFYIDKNRSASFYECWSSGLLETFCEMREEFPRAFEEAQHVLHNWIQNKYFRTYAIFPYRVYSSLIKKLLQKIRASKHFPLEHFSTPLSIPIRFDTLSFVKNFFEDFRFYRRQNSLYSQLMKSNSTCAFTLLEFYRVTGDNTWLEALLKWIRSAIQHFCDHGKVYMEVVPKSGMRRDASITAAFILVDALCDTIYFAHDAIQDDKERLLSIIEEILEHGWENRLGNGLVPYHAGAKFAHIDSQVDFAISLRRYAELSGITLYKERSIELMMRALQLHYSSEGYYTFSGEVAENVIDPKYNALLLKGLAHLITIDAPLYPEYYSLFKDR